MRKRRILHGAYDVLVANWNLHIYIFIDKRDCLYRFINIAHRYWGLVSLSVPIILQNIPYLRLIRTKCVGCMKTIKDPHLVRCMSTVCDKSFCTQCYDPDCHRKKQWRCSDCCASQKRVEIIVLHQFESSLTMLLFTDTEHEPTKLTDQLRAMTEAFSALKAQLN